jgi:hypothetical protein
VPSFGPRFWFVETTEGGERRRVGFQERRPTQADAELEARRADVGTAVCIISLDDRYPANELSRECVAQGVFVRKPREMAASPRRGRGGSRRGGLGAVRSGQFFVIIDKRTGQAVNREIYDNVDAADAALDAMGGEAQTGFQVVDALWHNPSRARLRASGMGVDGLRTEARGLGVINENTRKHWDGRMWREPDVYMDGVAIWYGHGGAEGENATMIERSGSALTVTEFQAAAGYIEEPEDTFLTHSTTLDAYDVVDEVNVDLLQLRRYPLAYDDVNDLELLRWAVGLGIAHLFYWGGEESWADELPR